MLSTSPLKVTNKSFEIVSELPLHGWMRDERTPIVRYSGEKIITDPYLIDFKV